VAYGNEIADDLVADVSPSLEYFLGCWPILVADLAGAENMPAAPASFDVLDAFEQLGGSGARVTRVPAICGCQLLGVGGDVTTAAALWMAQRGEEATRDVDDLQVVLICFLQNRLVGPGSPSRRRRRAKWF
jgi:hypothetical protein